MAKLQGCATVGAVKLKETYTAALITKGHQILTKSLERKGRLFELMGNEDGLPEAA
jgi:hypothetical protein